MRRQNDGQSRTSIEHQISTVYPATYRTFMPLSPWRWIDRHLISIMYEIEMFSEEQRELLNACTSEWIFIRSNPWDALRMPVSGLVFCACHLKHDVGSIQNLVWEYDWLALAKKDEATLKEPTYLTYCELTFDIDKSWLTIQLQHWLTVRYWLFDWFWHDVFVWFCKNTIDPITQTTPIWCQPQLPYYFD